MLKSDPESETDRGVGTTHEELGLPARSATPPVLAASSPEIALRRNVGPPFPRSPRRRGPGLLLLPVAAVVLLMGMMAPLSAGLSLTTANRALPAIGPSSFQCNAVYTPTPSALLVQIPEPGVNLSAGGSMGYEMELQITNYSFATGSINLTFPRVFFSFPLASGATFSIALAPQNISVNSSGWTSHSVFARSSVVPGGLAFAVGAKARMTTQKLSVMASVAYGVATLEVRWRWTDLQPNATKSTYGPWSVPTAKAHWPTQVPSIFYPAAFVSLVNTSGSRSYIGGYYTMTIGGPSVAGQWFFQELEFPSTGKVVEGYAETAPANASAFGVTVHMLNYGHFLVPGTYLAHVHDQCGAMLYSRSVVAVFAPSANITFLTTPGCGKITFDGQKFANNTTAAVVPSTTTYNVSAQGCAGHPFNGTILTGGLHAITKTRILVSSDGTLRFRYV